MDLVPPQCGVTVRLDPHASHGVVKDLVVLDEAQTWKQKTVKDEQEQILLLQFLLTECRSHFSFFSPHFKMM